MKEKDEKPRCGFMTRNYLVLTLTSTLWGIPTSICNTYFSLYVFALGGTETIIGLVTAVGSATFVIFAIMGGHVADLYGRKKIVGLMTILLGLSQLLMASSPSWQFLALAIMVTNICWVFEPAYWAILADSIRVEKRGTAFALYSCLSFLPWAIMPSIGGYFVDVHGVLLPMRWSYVASAMAGIVAGAVRWLMLKETIFPRNVPEDERRSLKGLSRLIKDAFNEHFKTWSWMPHSALALTAIYILWAFEFGLVEPYWIVYAEDIIGVTSTQWGIITATGSAISIVFKILVVGRLLDQFSRRRILLTITALDVFTYVVFINCRMFTHVLALWIPASIIWSFYEPTYSSLEADLIPEERRGRVFAAFGVAWSTFTVPASLIGGFVYEQISPQLSFVMASIGISICSILTALLIKTPES